MPAIDKIKDENVVVMNHRASGVYFNSPTFALIPGENNVPKSVVDKNRDQKNGVVDGWFTMEPPILEIKSGKKKAQPLGNNLSGVAQPRALLLVETTENVGVLAQWRKAEKRPTVKQAITARLQMLSDEAEGIKLESEG